MANAKKLSEEISNALWGETSLPNAKLETLRDFTLLMLRNHGNASDTAITAFLDACYTHRNMPELVLGMAQKTISNYVNHLVRTPVDK